MHLGFSLPRCLLGARIPYSPSLLELAAQQLNPPGMIFNCLIHDHIFPGSSPCPATAPLEMVQSWREALQVSTVAALGSSSTVRLIWLWDSERHSFLSPSKTFKMQTSESQNWLPRGLWQTSNFKCSISYKNKSY